jgi:hypothetical protein
LRHAGSRGRARLTILFSFANGDENNEQYPHRFMTKTSTSTTGIPEGFAAKPVARSDEGAALRICVIVREIPDVVLGPFVLLRDVDDAKIYLGCIVDNGGRVQSWLELWVQNVNGLGGALPSHQESFSNRFLDERWQQRAAAFRDLLPRGFIETGWEKTHPLPSFLSGAGPEPVHPGADEAAGPWKLCGDDSVLEKAGLPAYSKSLYRYLHRAGGGKEQFIPVVAGAPENSSTIKLPEALANANDHWDFNAQGGLMMVAELSPIAFDDYADLLGSKPWKGIELGKKYFSFDGDYKTLGDWNDIQQNGAHLFRGLHGGAGRYQETFHLKLQLLLDAFRLVHSFVERQQLPFLNLAADSLRVSLGGAGAGLPLLWTARTALAKTSCAVALPVETSDFRYFIRTRAGGPSIYLPEGLTETVQGAGSVRIRKVLPPDQDRTSLEGTLVLQDKLTASPHDLLWIRLPLPAGRVDLYGHLYATESLAQGEARFRTVPQKLPEAVVTALRGAEGVSFARSPFEIVPLLSSPCDLYSLAVLAVRTLLVDDKTTLAVSLDEALSLARQVAAEHKPDQLLAERIRALFAREPRYAASLAPNHLMREPIKPEDAFRLVPEDLWFDVLGLIIRLFPGVGPDSFCRDFGDVPSLALETVFSKPIAELERLMNVSRSLIVIDWNFNREIHEAIQGCLSKNRSLQY